MDLNIDTIQIIIQKREPVEFHFHNLEKGKDGFVLFTEGSVRFLRRGREPELLNRGDLVLLRKGEEYRFSTDAPCAYVTAEFSFSPDCGKTLEQLPGRVAASRELQRKILEAETLWQARRWDHPIAARILLLEIYREILRQTCISSGPSEKIVSAAKDYLHSHFRENFSTAAIAAHCGVSLSHLRAVFGKETGMSITEFRNLLRIHAAKEMLSSNLFSVRETAEALGYCDVYYFSKSFRQATGSTPGQFKNREQKD